MPTSQGCGEIKCNNICQTFRTVPGIYYYCFLRCDDDDDDDSCCCGKTSNSGCHNEEGAVEKL